ncbi:MAG: hypothetical protein KDA41_20785 [Planctomycetales bacterium]|nr:hypothetical protein [Planctomycetales bacterium]
MEKEFRSLGLVVVKGAGNYLCDQDSQPGLKVWADGGSCRAGADCPLKAGGCRYYDTLRAAKGARIVVANYAAWLAFGKTIVRTGKEEPLGRFDQIVCDEAHTLVGLLSDLLTVEFPRDKATAFGLDLDASGSTPAEWQAWAKEREKEFKPKLAQLREGQPLRDGREIVDGLGVLAASANETWAVDRGDKAWRFGPTKIPKWAVEKYLLRDTPAAVLVSATIAPATLDLAGFEPGDWTFRSYPSSFAVERRLVTGLPSVRVNQRTTDSALLRGWLPVIDSLLDRRLDRKGIIHGVSYKRAQWIAQHSRHASIFITHGPGRAAAAINRFRAATPPAVLLSPAVTTGADFPGRECEFQLIVKLPWPYLGDDLFRARLKKAPRLGDYLAAQDLVQAAGRGVRHERDQCETFVVDDAAIEWVNRNVDLLPMFFIEAWRQRTFPPPPPPRLTT